MTNGSQMLITQRINIDMRYIFKADKLKYNCNDQTGGVKYKGVLKSFQCHQKGMSKKIKSYVWSDIRK